MSSFGDDVKVVARNLYSLLAQRTRGKAQTIAKLVPDKNGFEVWRQLWNECRPAGVEPSHSLLCTIINPKWWSEKPHKDRPFMELLRD